MATISATISGAPLKGFQNFSFEIELGLGKRAKRATCRAIYDTDAYAGTKAKSGQVLRISIDGSEAFEGPIHVVTGKWINPEAYEVTIDATDWTPFLDAKLVHTSDLEGGELPEQPLSQRVAWILVRFCPGFTLGTIDNDVTLPAQSFDRQPASSVFDELAELTDHVFDLSFNKQVSFYQTGGPAPISAIDVDTDLTISDVEATEDWSDLHNVLLIKDFKLRSFYSYEEEFAADGHTSFFSLGFPPWSVNETVVSISKDGGGEEGTWTDRVSITDALGNQSDREMYRGAGTETELERAERLMELSDEYFQDILQGIPDTVNICLWNQGIRFPLVDIPADGDIIRVRYPFERQQQILEVRDLTSIGVIAAREGTDGIHQKVINIPELRAVSLVSAINYARMLLARGAWPVLTGSFQTYVTGWQPRQKFTIGSAVRDITDPKPPYGAASVWVSRVLLTVLGVNDDGTALVDHTVEFTSLPYAVPIPLDEIIWRLIDRTSWLRPPGNIPAGTEYTTSTSTTTTMTVTSTSTTTTATSTSTTLWGGAETPVRAQVMFAVPGTLAVGNDQAPWFICSISHGLTLLDTSLAVKTAPTGAAIEIDIQRSTDCGATWSSIYSTKPTIPVGSRGCDESGVLETTYIVEGDILRLDITQVGSTVAGADLTVSLRVRQGTGFTTSTSTTSGTSTSTTISGTSTSTTTMLMSWQSPSSVYSLCGQELGGLAHSLIDGDTGTAWMHLTNEAHEIVLNMGETKYITKARLYVYHDQDQSLWRYCDIYVSDNPAAWGSAVRTWAIFTKDFGAGWVVQTFSVNKWGRYVRITGIDTEDVRDHIMGAEFEVYASG